MQRPLRLADLCAAAGEQLDDDIEIEGGPQLAPNARCPITSKPVSCKAACYRHCSIPSVGLLLAALCRSRCPITSKPAHRAHLEGTHVGAQQVVCPLSDCWC